MIIREVKPQLDSRELDDLKTRLARTRVPELEHDWQRGVTSTWITTLIADWLDFDPAAFQRRLDSLDHFEAEVGDQLVHFVRADGEGVDPVPIVLTHGWPGSFLEHLCLIPLLTRADASGRSFTVVLPSLPGYGFSSAPPPGGLSAATVADLWHELMTDGLGFPRYVAHGSDLGARVTARLAQRHPDSVNAIHLASPALPAPPEPWSAAEEAFVIASRAWAAEEGGYLHEHSTKPSTLGIGLNDSPAGLAAWIGEKVESWSSTRDDGAPAFDRVLLLETLTVYWVTQTITSSFLPYWATAHDSDANLTEAGRVSVPTAVSLFGGEVTPLPQAPRELAERYFEVAEWNDFPVGGHFPAVAEPELLANTLRAFLLS